jgi:hypothetical protein
MEATQQLMIALEVRQWNDVVEALNNAPFRLAAPIIQEIVRQHNDAEMRAQSEKAQSERSIEPDIIPSRSNGASHAGNPGR